MEYTFYKLKDNIKILIALSYLYQWSNLKGEF